MPFLAYFFNSTFVTINSRNGCDLLDGVSRAIQGREQAGLEGGEPASSHRVDRAYLQANRILRGTHLSGRLLAIGDIHGCANELKALLDQVEPGRTDTLITLGDYVNRGPDSKQVLELLIDVSGRTTLVPLLGNHDAQMLEALADETQWSRWFGFGGLATLYSYSATLDARAIPQTHIDFLRSCRRYHETETMFFVHANYKPELPLDQQPDEVLLSLSLRDVVPGPHVSGKKAVVGHTPQKDFLPVDLGHLLCLDTACVNGGRLTAMSLLDGQFWQVSRIGRRVAGAMD